MNILPLIEALIAVESGGNTAAVGDHGHSVGILQIQQQVITDINRVYKTQYRWPVDAQDPQASRDICNLYLSYWGLHFQAYKGRQATYQELARIWNGGPTGWRKTATEPYWAKVRNALAKIAPEIAVT